jgi:hypothetical protein
MPASRTNKTLEKAEGCRDPLLRSNVLCVSRTAPFLLDSLPEGWWGVVMGRPGKKGVANV